MGWKRKLWFVCAFLSVLALADVLLRLVWTPTIIDRWGDIIEGGPPRWLELYILIFGAIGGIGLILVEAVEKLRRK